MCIDSKKLADNTLQCTHWSVFVGSITADSAWVELCSRVVLLGHPSFLLEGGGNTMILNKVSLLYCMNQATTHPFGIVNRVHYCDLCSLYWHHV